MADPNTTNSDSGKGIIVMAVDYSNNSEWAFDCKYSLSFGNEYHYVYPAEQSNGSSLCLVDLL